MPDPACRRPGHAALHSLSCCGLGLGWGWWEETDEQMFIACCQFGHLSGREPGASSNNASCCSGRRCHRLTPPRLLRSIAQYQYHPNQWVSPSTQCQYYANPSLNMVLYCDAFSIASERLTKLDEAWSKSVHCWHIKHCYNVADVGRSSQLWPVTFA